MIAYSRTILECKCQCGVKFYASVGNVNAVRNRFVLESTHAKCPGCGGNGKLDLVIENTGEVENSTNNTPYMPVYAYTIKNLHLCRHQDIADLYSAQMTKNKAAIANLLALSNVAQILVDQHDRLASPIINPLVENIRSCLKLLNEKDL